MEVAGLCAWKGRIVCVEGQDTCGSGRIVHVKVAIVCGSGSIVCVWSGRIVCVEVEGLCVSRKQNKTKKESCFCGFVL